MNGLQCIFIKSSLKSPSNQQEVNNIREKHAKNMSKQFRRKEMQGERTNKHREKKDNTEKAVKAYLLEKKIRHDDSHREINTRVD